MKNKLLIVLFILLGFSQQIIPQITETYDNGNVKNITYHKKYRTGIEKVKYEEYFVYEQKSSEGTYKGGKFISAECWDYKGNEKDCN